MPSSPFGLFTGVFSSKMRQDSNKSLLAFVYYITSAFFLMYCWINKHTLPSSSFQVPQSWRLLWALRLIWPCPQVICHCNKLEFRIWYKPLVFSYFLCLFTAVHCGITPQTVLLYNCIQTSWIPFHEKIPDDIKSLLEKWASKKGCKSNNALYSLQRCISFCGMGRQSPPLFQRSMNSACQLKMRWKNIFH